MDLDTLAQHKTTRRLLVGMVLILALGYLLTHTFEYSCVFVENQNSPDQGCTTGEQKKTAMFFIWFIVLIGYLFYELSQAIEVVDRT